MDMQYAVNNGLKIKTGLGRCNYLEFADGSRAKMVGKRRQPGKDHPSDLRSAGKMVDQAE